MLPDPVTELLCHRVGSLAQLQVLLLLHQDAARSWIAKEVAYVLRLPVAIAAEALEALGRRDLLDVRVADDVRYRYAPSSVPLRETVTQLADCFRKHREDVTSLVGGGVTRRDDRKTR